MSDAHAVTALSSTSLSSPPCDPDEVIPQSRLGRELFISQLSSQPVEYIAIWRAIASGKVQVEPLNPLSKRVGVKRKNLSALAIALGLHPVAETVAA